MTDSNFDASQHPMKELMNHILAKSWQTGSLLGVVLPVPWLLYKGNFTSSAMLRAAGFGGLTGLVLLPCLFSLKVHRINEEGLVDRAYRLHKNSLQHRCDKFALIGSVVSALAMMVIDMNKVISGDWISAIGTLAIGSAIGVLVHVATSVHGSAPSHAYEEIKTLPD